MLDLVQAKAPDTLISVADAKAHLDIEHDDDNELIRGYVEAAHNHLDGLYGVLGRSIVTQDWTLYLDRFPCGDTTRKAYIRLPLPPIVEVTTIQYVDQAGVTQSLDPADYTVLDGPVSWIAPAWGRSWPISRCHPRSVIIAYSAGYGAPDDAPAALRSAALLMVADLYANREAVVTGPSQVVLENPTVQRLVLPYKNLRI